MNCINLCAYRSQETAMESDKSKTEQSLYKTSEYIENDQP